MGSHYYHDHSPYRSRSPYRAHSPPTLSQRQYSPPQPQIARHHYSPPRKPRSRSPPPNFSPQNDTVIPLLIPTCFCAMTKKNW